MAVTTGGEAADDVAVVVVGVETGKRTFESDSVTLWFDMRERGEGGRGGEGGLSLCRC